VKLVTTRQIKAARALLGWSQGELARHSSISEPTIARLESIDGEITGRPSTAEKIKGSLEKAGIQFIDENGGGPGVRLRKRQRVKKQK
jgi:predicted transcriptional regulator